MFKNIVKKFAQPVAAQAETTNEMPIGVLWFIHDDPGITEKVPYICEDELLDAIQNFYCKYGADHHNEFMVIFTDPANEALNARIKYIVGADYDICNMMTQPRLF